jgi:RNA polymerase subunit RPABC4/transcription elongation factor Spt4
MQTCSNCNALSPDHAIECTQCGADLGEFSNRSVSLKRMQDNPRVDYVRVISSDNSCPACRRIEGAYDKTTVPSLPHVACSHEYGCRCFYLPFLTDIYP